MARYRMRIRTARPAPDTFAYLADLTNFPDWDPGIASSVQVEGDGPVVGAAYDVEASGSTFRYVVDAYDPPRQIRAVGRNRWMTSVDTITVAEADAGAEVTYEADLQLRGLLRLGDPILSLAFRRIGDRSAEGLRAELDGERVA